MCLFAYCVLYIQHIYSIFHVCVCVCMCARAEMDSRLLLFLTIACAVSRIDGQTFNITTFTVRAGHSFPFIDLLSPMAGHPVPIQDVNRAHPIQT